MTAFHRMLFAFLLLLPFFKATTSAQINSVSISADSKSVALDFAKATTSFIYLLPIDGGKATRLTDATAGWESSPSFSADGSRIAYSYRPTADGKTEPTIVIRSLDVSRSITWPASSAAAFWPAFSPDNQTIVFARSNYYGSYSPIAQSQHHAWNFFKSDLAGSNAVQLTSESFYMASPPSVSPDGQSMVIAMERADGPRQIAIYSMDHPGKTPQLFRPHVEGEPDHGPILNSPNYLPDGDLLFMAATDGKHGYDYDVYRLELKTSRLERLTRGNGYATGLKVSANGKTAVFLKWHSNWRGIPVRSEVCVLDLHSHQTRTVKVTGLE
jgi:Tol biopolymer transport system component